MNDLTIGAVLAREDDGSGDGSCRLELLVEDALVAAELLAHPAGPERDQYALTALRIGVLALKQAQGRLDADVIRGEGDRVLALMEDRLASHQRTVHDHIALTLREHFDPRSGRFNERVERLVKPDGELEQLMRAQIGALDSELAKTLAAHVGEPSALMKILRPSETEGIVNSVSVTVQKALEAQRNAILCEFSLDNGGGALARLVRELNEKHGQLANGLRESVDEVIGEFSLDRPDSALSRLVGQVEAAQRRLSSEFSLDEQSSALARLQRGFEQLLEKSNRDNEVFRSDVRAALASLQSRREESFRSTRHGLEFEQAVFAFLADNARAASDVVEHTAGTTGLIKNCKVGDAVLTLGPEHAAAGSRIVIEAKQDASYGMRDALTEIEQGRKNRQADVGLFVFSRRACGAQIAPLGRYGSDIVVAWDSEDPATDVILNAGVSLARALCTRAGAERKQLAIDVERMQKAMLDIEKQIQGMDEIRKNAQSIRSCADKIEDRARIVSDNIARAARVLDEETDAIGALVTPAS